MIRPAIIVAGPTASGKSGLALALARAFDGVVINADSMQVYDVLRVVTARPGAEEEAQAPHRLYGVLSPAVNCSAAAWKDRAAAAMADAWAAGKLPVVVGGTGLYLRTLMHGISPAPDIPDEVRMRTRPIPNVWPGPGKCWKPAAYRWPNGRPAPCKARCRRAGCPCS